MSGVESSSAPWGSRFTISIYVAGDAEKAADWIRGGLENFALPPGTDLVGMSVESVQDEPRDQGRATPPRTDCPALGAPASVEGAHSPRGGSLPREDSAR